MKVYEVTRSTSGQIGVLVRQSAEGPTTLVNHCKLHSPTGMETGYGGSGPADLAASILADYLCVAPERLLKVWTKSWGFGKGLAHDVLRLHQDFKRDFIASRTLGSGQSYKITSDEIALWMAETKHAKNEECALTEAQVKPDLSGIAGKSDC